jgi:hypothetical protein
MNTNEIKQALLAGQSFGNESANWHSVCKPSQGLFWIVIGDRNLFCKNIDSMARRISKLINTGA